MNEVNQRTRIVFGLGSGRSGTASLAALLNTQSGGICFHEMNPSCAVFSGNPQIHVNIVREFQTLLGGGNRAKLSIDYTRPSSIKSYEKLQVMDELLLIGDIAFYYLNYVDDLLHVAPECIFVCIKRNRAETINSWLKKSSIKRWRSLWLAERLQSWLTRTPFQNEYNYWQEHDGTRWRKDPVWDSCFPKFSATSKEEAIGLYWDYYYLEADRLQKKYPDRFKVFDVETLSSTDGQKCILEFIGLAEEKMVCVERLHLHQSDRA